MVRIINNKIIIYLHNSIFMIVFNLNGKVELLEFKIIFFFICLVSNNDNVVTAVRFCPFQFVRQIYPTSYSL